VTRRGRVSLPEGDGQCRSDDHYRQSEAKSQVFDILTQRVFKHGNTPFPFEQPSLSAKSPQATGEILTVQ
jgi:hypothetical protein